MSCTKECPICMENICGDKNCVTTDCGQNFHASCLFKNMAHNGFGCPYCRTELAEVPEEDEDSEDEDDDDDWIDDDDEPYSNSSLRRVREMFQEDYNAAARIRDHPFMKLHLAAVTARKEGDIEGKRVICCVFWGEESVI